MPRLKKETEEQRLAAKMAAMFGDKFKYENLPHVQEKKEEEIKERQIEEVNNAYDNVDTQEDIALEAESVILYYELKGKGFQKKICPTCGQIFAIKYKITGGKIRCSNICRKQELEKIGVDWDPTKPPEKRWIGPYAEKGELPLILSPPALKAVEKALGADDNTDEQP